MSFGKRDIIVIVVDEVGDPGKYLKRKNKKNMPNRIFGMGASVVGNVDGFADIARSFKEINNIKGEFKARKRSTLEKISLGWRIRRSGAKTYGYYIDKRKDVPEGWNEQRGTDVQIGMLQEVLDRLISKSKHERITVVVDGQDIFVDKKTGRNIVADMSDILSSKHDKKIFCSTVSEKNDKFFDLMETNDIVANAVNDRKELKRPWASFIMGQKIIRLGRKDSIRKR